MGAEFMGANDCLVEGGFGLSLWFLGGDVGNAGGCSCCNVGVAWRLGGGMTMDEVCSFPARFPF